MGPELMLLGARTDAIGGTFYFPFYFIFYILVLYF
jgi:hypothetical protein